MTKRSRNLFWISSLLLCLAALGLIFAVRSGSESAPGNSTPGSATSGAAATLGANTPASGPINALLLITTSSDGELGPCG